MLDREGDGKKTLEELGLTGEPESQEQLDSTYKWLRDLKRPDGTVVSLSKQELGVIAKTLAPAGADDLSPLVQYLMIADYIDEDEADNVSGAIAEADRYGMSREPILVWIANRIATNRKGLRTNRVAQLYDMFSHTKFTTNQTQGKKDGFINPRSPIKN